MGELASPGAAQQDNKYGGAPGSRPSCRRLSPLGSARCVRWGRLGEDGDGTRKTLAARALGPGRRGGLQPWVRHQGQAAPGHVGVGHQWARGPGRFVRGSGNRETSSQLAGARLAGTEGKPSFEGGRVGQLEKRCWSGARPPGGLSKWKPRVRSKLPYAPRSRPGSPGSVSWKRPPGPQGSGLGRLPGVRAVWVGGTWRCQAPNPPPGGPSRRPPGLLAHL